LDSGLQKRGITTRPITRNSAVAVQHGRLSRRIFREYVRLTPEYGDEPDVCRAHFHIIHKQEVRMKTRAVMLFSTLLLACASAFAYHYPAGHE